MRVRLMLVTALTGSLLGIGSATPAGATCRPEKPSTCEPCRITGVDVGRDGVQIETDCP